MNVVSSEDGERPRGEKVWVVYGCLSSTLSLRLPLWMLEVGRGKQVNRLISGLDPGFVDDEGG